MKIFFDLEADGFLRQWDHPATKITALVANVHTEDGVDECTNLSDVFTHVYRAVKAKVIGHNIIDYDLPMIEKFFGVSFAVLPDRWGGKGVEFIDTLLLSKTLNPDRDHPEGFTEQWTPSYPGQKLPGPHSLEAWGFRLGTKKPSLIYKDVNEQREIPYEINLAQCRADVQITELVYEALVQEANAARLPQKALKCEQAVRFIMTGGVTEGVPFDTELAERCIPELDGLLEELREAVEPSLPPRSIPDSKIKMPPKVARRVRANNTPSVAAEKYFGEITDKGKENHPEWWIFVGTPDEQLLVDYPEDAPLEQKEAMLMSHSGDVKQWLMDEHGWLPTMWNIKKEADGTKTRTTPKFHEKQKICVDLERISFAVPIVEKIMLWLSYRNRRNVIRSENGTGWLNHPRLAIDGRLPADADTIGTGTFRFTHKVVANIPRAASLYGENMRSLFKAEPGNVVVGWDASSLEDRCKAHYCYNEVGGAAYVEKILDPMFDVHGENALNWGMERQATKNGHYALQYMARPPKLAETLSIDLETAEQYYEDWWARNQPLKDLLVKVDAIADANGGKWLPAIDGRAVPCRYKHSRGNSLMQSAGAIAMKYAMVWWYTQIQARGIPAKQIIHYHDEAVAMCEPQYAEEVGELGVQSIRQAGNMLNFRVPLLSEYKIGDSWKDIH